MSNRILNVKEPSEMERLPKSQQGKSQAGAQFVIQCVDGLEVSEESCLAFPCEP